MSKIRTCAYCRVSTGSEEQLNSFTNQKQFFVEHISKSKDMELVEVYADKGLTGTSLYKRPEFNKMLRDAGLDIVDIRGRKYVTAPSDREPKFNLILVSNTSRFARNILVVDILRDLDKKDVHVHFLDINKTTANPDDWSYIQLFLNFDEDLSRNMSKKIRWGQLQSAKNGRLHMTKKLYGYHYDTKTKTLSINEEEAKVIRLMFELYSQGYGFRRLTQELERRGIVNRQGKPFNQGTITKMIKNPIYKGTLVRNRFTRDEIFSQTRKRRLRPRKEWKVFHDHVPAIVSPELWDKCDQLLKSKVNHIKAVGINKGRSEYAGKLFCAKCGAPYTRNYDKKNLVNPVFYNCRTKKVKGVKYCDAKNINHAKVKEQEELLVQGFRRNIKQLTSAYIGQLEAIKRVLFSRLDESRANEIAELQQQREQTQERLEQLLKLMANPNVSVSAESITNTIQELDKQLATLDSKVDELSKDNTAILADVSSIERLQIELEQMQQMELSRQQILSQVQKMLVVYTPEADELRIDFTLEIEQKIADMTAKYIGSEAHQQAVSDFLDNATNDFKGWVQK